MKSIHSSYILLLFFSLGFVISFSRCDLSTPNSSSKSSVVENEIIQGRLLKIEGSTFSLKTPEGSEISFQATSDTLVDESMKIGDHIMVSLSHHGDPIAMRKVR